MDRGLIRYAAVVLASSFFLNTAVFSVYQERMRREVVTHQSLSNDAFLVTSDLYDHSFGRTVRLENKDVDGDGALESVLIYTNPVTSELEERLVFLDADSLRIKDYKSSRR